MASAEPKRGTTSSSALEAAAGRHTPADRSTGATASAWLSEQDLPSHLLPSINSMQLQFFTSN